MSWLGTITVVAQLIALIVKNYFENDAKEKARKEALHAEAKEAISSGDKSRITAIFDKLRQ